MKEIIEVLSDNRVVCNILEEKKLNTKKKIRAFLGVNLKNEYCLIVVVYKKSRFLLKDAQFLVSIDFGKKIKYKRKILILKSDICSKSKEFLKEWRIFRWY